MMSMKLLEAIGISTRGAQQSLSPAVLPPARQDSLGIEALIGLESVFRSLTYLQTLAGQLTIDCFKDAKPVASQLIDAPTFEMTQREWIIRNVSQLSISGNAFWKIKRDPAGKVINIEVIDSARVSVAQDANYKAVYAIDGQEIASTSIAHLRYLTLPERQLGLGPIQAARAGLTGMVKLQKYADDLFTRGGIPSGILTTDQALTAEQAEEASRRWDENMRAGKTAAVGKGLDWRSAGVSPADLQWLESQKWNTTRIARLFGIPPHKLAAAVEGASLTYQNIEQSSLDSLRDTLMGYLSPIEDALTRLLPRGQYARFNLDAVLRPDTKTRYEAHEIGLRAGFLTVEEVREMEGRGPIQTGEPKE